MSPGFQYDAPLGTRMSDPHFLRHHLANMARMAEQYNKPALAIELRNSMNLRGDELLRAALQSANAVRA